MKISALNEQTENTKETVCACQCPG